MILVAGGTGRLGTLVVPLLRGRGLAVRVLTRDPARAAHLDVAETIQGDVRDSGAVARAVTDVQTVISAIQGFAGSPDVSPATVDRDGNVNLIRAARDAGVEHVVLLSIQGASPGHPMELVRMKYAAEQELRASGLAWTILRAGSYMETWCEVLGGPLLATGATQVFGEGRNPINWVSAVDVARFVELSVVDPAMRGQTIDVGGPENLSMVEFVGIISSETGRTGEVRHVPREALRLGAIDMADKDPGIARQMEAGLAMDTWPFAFDALATRGRFPSIAVTPLAEVVRQRFAAPSGGSPKSAHAVGSPR